MTEAGVILGREIAESVYKELSKQTRGPFLRQLARLMGCAPGEEALREFAAKHPDRWAQAVAIIAPLAGIQRDAPVQVNVLNVSSMSDAALIARARALGIAIDALVTKGSPQLVGSADVSEQGTDAP